MAALPINVIIVEAIANLLSFSAADSTLGLSYPRFDQFLLSSCSFLVHSVRVEAIVDTVKIFGGIVFREVELLRIKMYVNSVVFVQSLLLKHLPLLTNPLALHLSLIEIKLKFTVNLLILH